MYLDVVMCFFLKILLFIMYMYIVFYLCVCLHARRGHQITLQIIVSHHVVCWELNSGPLEEQTGSALNLQGFSIYPWLSWNSLCRLGWPWTEIHLPISSKCWDEGMCHHAWLVTCFWYTYAKNSWERHWSQLTMLSHYQHLGLSLSGELLVRWFSGPSRYPL